MATHKKQLPFIRVNDDYYKKIKSFDMYGNEFEMIVPAKRQTILDDYGKEELKRVKKYSAFVNIPNNISPKTEYDQTFNLYAKFEHKPAEGPWVWTERLIRHIFGEQYEIGLDYLQLLFEKPIQRLPILCLVSRENATGKTTFVDWLFVLFAGNVSIVGNQDIIKGFNSHYATNLVVAVDESKIDKQSSLEKLKAMATQKVVTIDAKFQQPYTVGYFGKIILLSNYEDNFINAKDEDIRYWIRKLTLPKHINFDIEQDLEKEIPAFVNFLRNRKLSTVKQSRMYFSTKAIETDALLEVKKQSKSWLFKEIFEHVRNHFDQNEAVEEFFASPADLKYKWFERDHRTTLSYIRKVLKDEFKLDSSPLQRYIALSIGESIVGRPFKFKREQFDAINKADNYIQPF